jgi:hypothetical protein
MLGFASCFPSRRHRHLHEKKDSAIDELVIEAELRVKSVLCCDDETAAPTPGYPLGVVVSPILLIITLAPEKRAVISSVPPKASM